MWRRLFRDEKVKIMFLSYRLMAFLLNKSINRPSFNTFYTIRKLLNESKYYFFEGVRIGKDGKGGRRRFESKQSRNSTQWGEREGVCLL